jgi:hypothetical protein
MERLPLIPETQAPVNGRNDVVAAALAARQQADELKGAAIKQLLAQREQIDQDLKALGYMTSSNGQTAERAPKAVPQTSNTTPGRRFRNLPLADIARVLLTEHGTLHGKEIQKLALAGGFKGSVKHFQTYMPTAFKRAGGFENMGKNRWRLNSDVEGKR